MATTRQASLSRSWTDKTEHRRLSLELAQAEGPELVRQVRTLLRAMWPHAELVALGDGVHRVEEGHGEPRVRIVLCVGFRSDQMKLGLEEARDACAAISRFAASATRADAYLLIHNRDGRSREFRSTIETRLKEMVDSGRVGQAELWSRQRFLQEAFNAMLRQVLSTVPDESRSMPGAADPGPALEAVRLRRSSVTIDQHQLKASVREPLEVSDPAALLLDPGDVNLSLLVGEFGSGKTTAVLRACHRGSLRPVYVPGAAISGQVRSTKDLLDSCFRHEGLFADRPDEVREVSQLLARPVLEYVLKDPALPMAMILDGVDESAFLTRRGGFQHLFNMLHDIQVPVVLTMRSELWHRGQGEFAAAFGERSSSQPLRHRRFRLIELLPWAPDQIGSLIERRRQGTETPQGRTRLAALADLAAAGRLGELYGDLPERPLFLHLILESVVELGLPGERVGKARLLRDWARFKVFRDDCEPIRAGGQGRIPLLDESEGPETTAELAWEAMVGAASRMVQEHDGAFELTGDCELEEVRASSPRLHALHEPLGLFLNSLLLGVPQPPGTPPRVRFAHRSFQEFFLAWAWLTRDGVGWDPPPPEVASWIRQIEEEGLLSLPDDAGKSRRSSGRGLSSPPRPTALPDLPPPYPDLVMQVKVDTREGAGRLSFVLTSVSGKAGFRRRTIPGKKLRTSPEGYQARLLETIEHLHVGTGVDGRPVLRSEATGILESLGRELYDELFPSLLRDAYHVFREDVESLLIVSEEPWIPWELVKPYDDRADLIDDDFLCARFQLTRWLSGEVRPTAFIEPRRMACFEAGVPPDGGRRLDRAAAEREWLEAFGRRNRLEDRSLGDTTRSDLLAILEEGGLGLVHLVGHGEADIKHPNESRFLLADGSSLRPLDLYGPIQTRLKDSRPLFFLNACQVGRLGWSLTGLGGWAARCVGGCGCGAFVAPQWTVADHLADAFATAFYDALEGGATFGRAAHEARHWIRQLDESQPDWLAYAVYAHPEGRLRLGGATGRAESAP